MSPRRSNPGDRRRGCRPLFIRIVVVFAVLPGCARPSQPSLSSPPPSVSPAQVRFSDVTGAAGIRFAHFNGAAGKRYLVETMGAGGGFLDYDGDGWLEILLLNGRPLTIPAA